MYSKQPGQALQLQPEAVRERQASLSSQSACLTPCAIYFGFCPAWPTRLTQQRAGRRAQRAALRQVLTQLGVAGYKARRQGAQLAARVRSMARRYGVIRLCFELQCRGGSGQPGAAAQAPNCMAPLHCARAKPLHTSQGWGRLRSSGARRIAQVLQCSVRPAAGAGAGPGGTFPQRANRGGRAAALYHVPGDVAHLPRKLPVCLPLQNSSCRGQQSTSMGPGQPCRPACHMRQAWSTSQRHAMCHS